MVGALLVAVLASDAFGGIGLTKGVTMSEQLGIQVLGLAATVIWSALATFVIVKVTATLTGGVRVDEEDELVGLDLATHGERGYDL